MRVRTALLAAATLAIATHGLASESALLAQANASASPSARTKPGPKPMIARVWQGRTLTTKADDYEKTLNATDVERILKAQGNHGVEVLRKTSGARTDFVVISYWESMEVVRLFAGPDFEKAVILARDREYLVEVEPVIVHYEVVRAAAR
jgi:heme-degrading monooxygenase HmoA